MRKLKRACFSNILIFLGLSGLVSSCSPTQSPPEETLPRLLETPTFVLTDQDRRDFSSSNLRGKIWLVDFIFTRCGGPCPLMTQKMVNLKKELESAGLMSSSPPVQLVSITVDPAHDTPPVLREYAETWQADWLFLTGPPERVLTLIRNGFKISVTRPEDPDGPHEGSHMDMPDISHSTHFLLVGPEGWVRKIIHLDDRGFQDEVLDGIRSLKGDGSLP